MDKYTNVVDDVKTLDNLGFVENVFYNWVFTLVDSPIIKSTVVAAGDYIFLKNEDPSNRRRVEIVTLWNRDVAGSISEDTLKTLVEILKQGNVRQKKG